MRFVRRSGQGVKLSAEGCALDSASQEGVRAHLIRVTKRMNADLKVTFDLNGEPVEVPCTVGVKQGCPPSEPDTLPFRHASLFGVPRDGRASGCEVEVSDQHKG